MSNIALQVLRIPLNLKLTHSQSSGIGQLTLMLVLKSDLCHSPLEVISICH